MLHLQTHQSNSRAMVVQAYTLTESADDAAKDEFYKQLQDTFDDIREMTVKVPGWGLQCPTGWQSARTRMCDWSPRIFRPPQRQRRVAEILLQTEWIMCWKHLLPALENPQEHVPIPGWTPNSSSKTNSSQQQRDHSQQRSLRTLPLPMH